MSLPHPKVVVFVSGKPLVMECDCGWCTPRRPRIGGAIVLAVAAAAYVLIALAVF